MKHATFFQGLTYAVLLLLRFYAICFHGYIHPDEFFQSSEVSSAEVFSLETVRTWEFDPKFPIRSYISVLLTSGIAFRFLRLLSHLCKFDCLTATTLFFAPKIFMFFFSFLVDLSAFTIIHYLSPSPSPASLLPSPLFLLFSSWPLLLSSHTLTNSLELFSLATTLSLSCIICFSIIPQNSTSHNLPEQETHNPAAMETHPTFFQKTQLLFACNSIIFFVFGCIISLGSYVRFTFVFSAIPILILTSLWVLLHGQNCNFETFGDKNVKSFSGRGHLVNFLVTVFNGVVFIFLFCLFLDKSFYGKWTITPFNFLLYNSKTQNLATHGVHPHYLHFFVNFPILLGPLSIIIYFRIIKKSLNLLQKIYSFVQKISKFKILDTPVKIFESFPNFSFFEKIFRPKFFFCAKFFSCPKVYFKMILFCSIFFPLFFLSLAKHQEPRFLLPLIFPFFLFFEFHILHNRYLFIIYIIFNLSMLFFFGKLHQGGVTPALVFLSQNLNKNNFENLKPKIFQNFSSDKEFKSTCFEKKCFEKKNEMQNFFQNEQKENLDPIFVEIIFFGTYMPPQHLLLLPRKDIFQVKLFDLKSDSFFNLFDSIVNVENFSKNSKKFKFLVIPRTSVIKGFLKTDPFEVNQINFENQKSSKRIKKNQTDQCATGIFKSHWDLNAQNVRQNSKQKNPQSRTNFEKCQNEKATCIHFHDFKLLRDFVPTVDGESGNRFGADAARFCSSDSTESKKERVWKKSWSRKKVTFREKTFHLIPVQTFWPHLSTEDMEIFSILLSNFHFFHFFKALVLEMYLVME